MLEATIAITYGVMVDQLLGPTQVNIGKINSNFKRKYHLLSITNFVGAHVFYPFGDSCNVKLYSNIWHLKPISNHVNILQLLNIKFDCFPICNSSYL